MAREFKLPDLGEGIHEGEIVEIFVAIGDAIKEGDPLMEVETDKAVTAIPSPFTGKVTEVRVKPGDTVHVGDVLVVFDGAAKESPVSTGKAEIQPEARTAPAAAQPQVEVRRTTERPASAAPAGSERPSMPVPAAPATRRLARELGVDLRQVQPSGPSGLVTAEDVKRHRQEGAAAPARALSEAVSRPTKAPAAPELPDFGKWGPVSLEPLRSVRRATARQMALAWSQIPHVANQSEADVTALEAMRRRHAPVLAAAGGRLTMTVLAAKAAAAALRRHPRFNASLDMARETIVYKHYCHIGVAVDTPRGLVVPNLRDVDRKSIRELAVEFEVLVQRAREGKTDLEALAGGTFTITNAGAVGGGHFTPIINFPQSAILGIGRAGLKPVVRQDAEGQPQIIPRLMMPLVLSFDHRIADGADAIRFLQQVIDMLEDPERFLLDV